MDGASLLHLVFATLQLSCRRCSRPPEAAQTMIHVPSVSDHSAKFTSALPKAFEVLSRTHAYSLLQRSLPHNLLHVFFISRFVPFALPPQHTTTRSTTHHSPAPSSPSTRVSNDICAGCRRLYVIDVTSVLTSTTIASARTTRPMRTAISDPQRLQQSRFALPLYAAAGATWWPNPARCF